MAETQATRDIMTLRHSCSHILASAVKKLYPDAKLGMGPAIEDGFYYDFDVKESFSPDDIKKIEKEMNSEIRQNLEFKSEEIPIGQARKLFKDEPYKRELIRDLASDSVSIYTQGKFTDLCRGPHVENSKSLKAFKLMRSAGAYWKGDSKNKQLQRIYGIVFPDKDELKAYLKQLEEAAKRNHIKLGKDLDLFSIHEEAPGYVFYHNKGLILKENLIAFWREKHKAKNYQEIQTPILLKKHLWETSGHWKNFKENMYTVKIDESDYAIKPMNCPGGILIYKEKSHSYRELPIRVGELGHVHRHELSGVLNGLLRLRAFTQDDSHIYCTQEQVEHEINEIIDMILEMYSVFGFSEYEFEVSTKPDKFVGTEKDWEHATNVLKNVLKKRDIKYNIDEGAGVFYGPKIDVKIKDSIGRKWQCATIQYDFNLPERFDLSYEGADGKKHRPLMIHRVIYGSLERFMGILIEHFAGKFPLWLSPLQIRLVTVADRFNDYAIKIADEMKENGLKVDIDKRAESISKKVREAQLQKINLIITIGEKEEESKSLAVRTLDGNVKFGVKLDEFLKKVLDNIEKKEINISFK